MKPFLVLGPKHWLTGVSGASNSGIGGIFKKAQGVSAIRGIGSFNQDDIGLLQAGPSATNVGTNVVDTPIAAAREPSTGTTAYMWILGSGGHIYRKDNSTTAATDKGASSQISSPATGIGILRIGSTPYLYYFQEAQIGRVSLATEPAARPDAAWVDNSLTSGMVSTKLHPTHNFLDSLYFGNDYYIGYIRDVAGSQTFLATALDVPQQFRVFALEDDGQYLVASLSTDKGDSTSNVESKIIFWDTTSSSWNKEWNVRDNIIRLKRVGSVLYGIGLRGIYQISYGLGVTKVWQKGTTYSSLTGRGNVLSSFNDALVVGGDFANPGGTIGFLGKPDPALPSAYHTPVHIDLTGTYWASFVDAEFINGKVLVGGTDNTLKLYPLAYTAGEQATGVSAETVRIPLEQTMKVNRVDILFGAQLASGDSLTVKLRKNDLTTDQTIGTVSYANHGAVRRVRVENFPTVLCDEIILTLTFAGGASKVKNVFFYGDPQEPVTA